MANSTPAIYVEDISENKKFINRHDFDTCCSFGLFKTFLAFWVRGPYFWSSLNLSEMDPWYEGILTQSRFGFSFKCATYFNGGTIGMDSRKVLFAEQICAFQKHSMVYVAARDLWD